MELKQNTVQSQDSIFMQTHKEKHRISIQEDAESSS